ncbi:hypothetical protein H6G89_26470 [Oscillatoria sp. FACHB-1407]|uniref:hypothetical protein n=1 Tax=Oscillatoria sp. FACHB-1407 TaxID=2692847 RepID=UPI001682D0E5|nr:hypothetical protein [Oscillatoria sp. FACHB-1407]MBD2464556.1 hypothetical protein [Oscillatoria sp. FACHB-1407]
MLISAKAHVSFPRSLVYATYRDKLLDLMPYMPNVRRIEIKSRQQEGHITKFVNEWHGGGEIPQAARALLSEELLSWTDRATWNDANFTANWQIETHAFTEAVFCAGKNRFLEVDGGTVIESLGELTIDPKKIKGMLPMLTGMVAQLVEDVLSKRIEPNLLQMSEGVQRYLEERREKKEE